MNIQIPEATIDLILVAERASDRKRTAPDILIASGLTKRVTNRYANQGVDFDLRKGEVLVLLGDNGAGKSTLIDTLCGFTLPDHGTVSVSDPRRQDGWEQLKFGSVRSARAKGIGFVPRTLALVDTLNGLENILLGTESFWRLKRNYQRARRKLDEIKNAFDIRVDLNIPTSQLSVGDRFRIALLRALYRDPRVLFLDEPTAILTPQDGAALLTALKRLSERGIAVVIATRDPDEALAIGHRIVVLRAGAKIADVSAAGQNRETLLGFLTGGPIGKPTLAHHATGSSILTLTKVDVANHDARCRLHEISLEVRAGEIIGIAGTSGNGQETLVAVISGLVTPSGGEVRLFGRIPGQMSPARFTRAGLGRVPADCRGQGMVADLSIAENIVLEDIRTSDFEHNGFLKRRAIRAHATRMLAGYGIGAPSIDASAAVLGDDDIQKLVLARVLDRNPIFILAHHPTRGLDLRTHGEVHRRLATERSRGAGIL
ncbi:MAG: ATP-binding cassette domain-containing protein, partial [Bradyrhizobiaceae bacterium]|nr:ATP-binding cassette domain-containing protein [Bradyrhizobiaceae bacterium]